MKALLLSFSTLIIIGASSCTKNIILRNEDKAVGTWKFEKVRQTNNLGFNREDITEDFENVTYKFQPDLTMIVNKNGVERTGIWRIESNQQYDANTNSYDSGLSLIGALDNTNGEDLALISWNNLCISKNKITCTSSSVDYNYTYKLIRN